MIAAARRVARFQLIAVRVADLGRSSATFAFRFEHGGALVAEGKIVAVRCLMHPGRKPEPVAIPEEIVRKLAAFRDG